MSTNKKIGICYLCLKFVLFTKFACFNLAAKLSVVNLLKSGVLIYLSWLRPVILFSISLLFEL